MQGVWGSVPLCLTEENCMDNRGRYNRRTGVRGAGASAGTVRRKKSSGGMTTLLKSASGTVDYMFLAIVILLITYGIIMLYSASSASAYAEFGDSLWYLKNQLKGVVIGAVAMFFISKVDYHLLTHRIVWGLYVGAAALLVLVIIPGVGTTTKGATRWLFGFQPSEVAKFAIIALFAYMLGQPSATNELKHYKTGMLKYLLILGLYVILLFLEPHMSCIILMGATAMAMLFFSGVPLKHFVGTIACIIPVGVVAIIKEPYRVARIMNFTDPFKDLRGNGWQVAQSLYAIGSGGIFGLGLGKSRQKFRSLPEPENDFIYSVLCEELGLVGAILLVALFMLLLIRGVKIALKAPDRFGTILTLGFVTIVMLQAMMNIAVVTASMPPTGMPLPFFSYGSTSLIITMAEMGIVLNVSRQSRLPI